MEVLVAGQGVHQVRGTGPREVKDGGDEVGDAGLQQEQGQPLGDELQRGQVVGLLGRHLTHNRASNHPAGNQVGW